MQFLLLEWLSLACKVIRSEIGNWSYAGGFLCCGNMFYLIKLSLASCYENYKFGDHVQAKLATQDSELVQLIYVKFMLQKFGEQNQKNERQISLQKK